MNQFQGVFPLEVDKYVVWGNLEAEHAIEHGVSPTKIESLGSPQYDPFSIKNKAKEDDFILIATSGFNKEESRGLTVETHEKYKETLKKIWLVHRRSHIHTSVEFEVEDSMYLEEVSVSQYPSKNY